MISYRIAEMSDARFLFHLKNDPGVCGSSILARDGVRWAEHRAWVGRTLSDRRVGLWIILDDGIPIGTWRIEHLAPGSLEVAIHLGAAWRGRGLGSKILDDWCRDFGFTWVAKVIDENEASIRLFTGNGFRAGGPCESNGVPYHIYTQETVQDP